MAFPTYKTSDALVRAPVKALLYGHHGWGKTTQAIHLQRRYGRGLILSGEAGLKSISSSTIDFLPFSSWDGEHDPNRVNADGNPAPVCSFVGLLKMIAAPEFKAEGFKWLMLDSITELSDLLLEHLEKKHAGSKNGFALWGEYGSLMLGAMKWVRDRDVPVLVTALAKDEKNDNGEVEFWPAVKGGAVQKQIPGIFDNVLCGVRHTSGDRTNPKVRRFLILDEVRGWHGKTRDPHRNLTPVLECDNVVEVFDAISRSRDEHQKHMAEMAKQKAALKEAEALLEKAQADAVSEAA